MLQRVTKKEITNLVTITIPVNFCPRNSRILGEFDTLVFAGFRTNCALSGVDPSEEFIFKPIKELD